MSSSRFNNTLTSVRQHKYTKEDSEKYFNAPFREESGSKIYFSIKPNDKIKKSKPQTTGRANRKRTPSGKSSTKNRVRNLSRYANGIKMSDRKKSYQFKGGKVEQTLYKEEGYTYERESSHSYKPLKLTERSPKFIDREDTEEGRLQRYVNRSKSAFKNEGGFDYEKFTQTMRNRRNRDEERDRDRAYDKNSRYSNFGNFEKYSRNNLEGDYADCYTNRVDNASKSPYKKFINESENIFTGRTPKGRKTPENYQKFFYPSFVKNAGKSNNSMISSRSFEVMDPTGKENKDHNKVSENNSKSRTKIRNIMLNSKTTRESILPNRNTTSSKKSHNLFFDFGSRYNNTVNNTNITPDDSYIFKPAYDGKSAFNHTMDNRRGFDMSPGISTRRRDKSKVSALDRSDISMKSRVSNANSYITKRDGSNPASRIKGVPCDSKLKNMSKTWVRSGLLESREDISTLKYRKNSNIDLSHSANKSKSKSRSVRKSRSINKKKRDKKNKKKKGNGKKLELDKLFIITTDNSNRDIRANEYELKKSIGQGAYAKVYKAIHLPTGAKVAVKLYQKSKLKDKLRQKSIKREIKILSKIHHENIVNFIDCFSTNNHIYLVMELVEGLSLYELLKKQPKRRISEENARSIIKQILRALNYCHSRNVTHRDIKLENVIVSNEGVVKIIDFGFSTCIPNEKKVRMFCGTPSYMAPEIVKKVEYRGPPVDIWATGVLFYVLLSGKFPFRGSSDKKLYYRISYSEIKFRSSIREKVCKVINHMMSKSAEDRPDCKELLEGYFCSRKYILKQAQKDKAKENRATTSRTKLNSKSTKTLQNTTKILEEISQNENKSQKIESTNQFNNLLKKLDTEYKAVKTTQNLEETSSKMREREKILSKYLNKSKTSYRARSPQTTRSPINENNYQQKSANRSNNGQNPSYIYFERSRRMLDNITSDRPSAYVKGDFTKFLENGQLPY